MGFSEMVRNIGHVILTPRKERDPIQRSSSTLPADLLEKLAEGQLVRFYTDPALLSAIGRFGINAHGFQQAGRDFNRMLAEDGLRSNMFDALSYHLSQELSGSMAGMALVRERALSRVVPERIPVIEGMALLEAKARLTERLLEPGLGSDYVIGAREMLGRIEEHLRSDIVLTGQNPK